MPRTPNALKTWMMAATPSEQQRLADAVCNGSRPYLYQLANEHTKPKAETASEIERLTARMNRETNGRLPVVWRAQIAPACASCEYARKCMAEAGVALD